MRVYVCCVHIEITATCCGWSACMSTQYIYTYHIIYSCIVIRCRPYYSYWICVCMYKFSISWNRNSVLWSICIFVSHIYIHISYTIYFQCLCLISFDTLHITHCGDIISLIENHSWSAFLSALHVHVFMKRVIYVQCRCVFSSVIYHITHVQYVCVYLNWNHSSVLRAICVFVSPIYTHVWCHIFSMHVCFQLGMDLFTRVLFCLCVHIFYLCLNHSSVLCTICMFVSPMYT